MNSCNQASIKFHNMFNETHSVLNIFKDVTDDMWTNISGDKFRIVEAAIRDCQAQIGAAVCALTVKTHAWNAEFRDHGNQNLVRKAEFLMGEMLQGIDAVEPIGFVDFATVDV